MISRVISRAAVVISRVTVVITYVRGLIPPFIATRETSKSPFSRHWRRGRRERQRSLLRRQRFQKRAFRV